MTLPTLQARSWTRGDFLISTDPELIHLDDLNKAFHSDQLDWAKQLPTEELKAMVDNSVCFGVYTSQSENGSRSMIGFGRLITDRVTIAYLTDVYILHAYQSKGLGSWLIDSVREWVDLMPNLRQLVLLAREGEKEQYYAKKLGTGKMEELGTGYRLFNRSGPGFAAE